MGGGGGGAELVETADDTGLEVVDTGLVVVDTGLDVTEVEIAVVDVGGGLTVVVEVVGTKVQTWLLPPHWKPS